MRLFFDTSALMKRYINETGSDKVDRLMDSAEMIVVSSVTYLESLSTVRRLLKENILDFEDYQTIRKNLKEDFKYFVVIKFDSEIETTTIDLIDQYQLKTLDSIQLASAIHNIDCDFVVSDARLIKAARRKGMKVVNPETPD